MSTDIDRLYTTLRRDIEKGDGSWDGGDVVEALCEWLIQLGYDVNGPNPYGSDDERDEDDEA